MSTHPVSTFAGPGVVPSDLAPLLQRLRSRFESQYGDRLVSMYLYGSQARGEARPDSDVDILVLLRGPVRPSLEVRRTGEIVSALSLESDRVLQCLFLDESEFAAESTPLTDVVRREGIPL